METAEHREPYKSRGSRTDLGAPGGESPPGNSTTSRARSMAAGWLNCAGRSYGRPASDRRSLRVRSLTQLLWRRRCLKTHPGLCRPLIELTAQFSASGTGLHAPDQTNASDLSAQRWQLGGRNHEAGAWKMHTDLADFVIAAPDNDLIGARGDQFADDRIASGIVRSDADCLARFPAGGAPRVGGCGHD